MKLRTIHVSVNASVRNRWIRVAIFVLAVLVLFAAFDPRMIIRRYVVEAKEISSEIRIALLTDLHSCKYGSGQNKLIGAVDDLAPDLVFLGGDIFDDDLPDTNTELFLAGVAERYPCYYVTGNHEYWSGPTKFAEKMAILNQYGITVLSGECETLSINGETINICGIDDPEAFAQDTDPADSFLSQIENVRTASDNDFYTVLLSHRPEYFDAYSANGFDLVLCGHAHGGQWRLPLILNGLFAPDQGFFPQYAGGLYTQSDTSMIVSRGLARESTRIPRVFNRPELLLIELK